MSRFIMVVFVAAECGNDKPQTNADGRGANACAEKKASVSEALSAKVCG